MSMEENAQTKNTLWWITSIAISVVCCSVLFILFASYLVEVKADLRDNMTRINIVEERENRILAEIEMMSRRANAAAASTPAASEPGAVAAPAATAPTTPATPAAQ